jgi:hypothetical protein
MFFETAKFYREKDLIGIDVSILKEKLIELKLFKNRLIEDINSVYGIRDIINDKDVNLEVLELELSCINWNILVFENFLENK